MTVSMAPWSEADEHEYARETKRREAEAKQQRRARLKFKRLRPIWKANAVEIHFTNEAPRIGSGRRRVFVETIGPKWVKIRSVATGQLTTLARPIWERLI